MRNTIRKFSIYAVSGLLSMTFFATQLAAAPRAPRNGDPLAWVRVAGRLLRGVLDSIGPVIGNK